ncbi:MAG: hypothetical protein V7754_01940 [Halioglobus sp.]
MEANKQRRNSRMVLLLIAGVPLTVILIATWLWYYVVEGDLDLVAMLGTSNSGTLVQPPRQLDDIDLSEPGSLPFPYSELDPKWTFLIPGGTQCDVTCEKMLYTSRQIHIAMGKEVNRIRRFYVSDTAISDIGLKFEQLSDERPAPSTFEAYLATEHKGMKTLTITPTEHRALLAEYHEAPDTWYLVDPAGWIMMSYSSDVDYKGVMSDLKFLLKNSSE